MKKVLMIVLGEFLNDPRVIREAELLSDKNYLILIICSNKNRLKFEKRNNNIHIARLIPNFFDKKGLFSYFLKYSFIPILIFFNFLKYGLFKEYKIIHIHNPPDFLVIPVSIISIFSKKHIILDRHEPFALSVSSILKKNEESLIFLILSTIELMISKLCNSLILINEYEKKYFLYNNIKKPMIVVGNSSKKVFIDENIKCNFILDKIGIKEKKKKKKILLYQGLISKRRDLDTLLKMMQLYGKTKFNLIILGDGDYFDELNTLIKNKNLEENIFLLKSVPLEFVKYYIMVSDICLVLAKNIPLYKLYTPTKIFEYLSLNKKTIVPFLMNIVHITNSLLPYYKPNDAKSLFDAIIRVDNMTISEINNISSKILSRNSWDKYSKRILNLYSSIS